MGYDPYNATQLALELQAAGYRVVKVPHTKRHMNEPAKLFEALVRSRRIRNDGNPLLRWCVSNVTAREDRAENLMLSKAAKNRRIDGVVAAVITLSARGGIVAGAGRSWQRVRRHNGAPARAAGPLGRAVRTVGLSAPVRPAGRRSLRLEG